MGAAAASEAVRVAVWGLGRRFQARAHVLLGMRDAGQVVLVGGTARDLVPESDAFGIPIMPRGELARLDFDLLVLMVASPQELMDEVTKEYGIPRERVVTSDLLLVPGIDLRGLAELRVHAPSVVSNGAWWGHASSTLGLSPRSPFVGFHMSDDDYLRLLADLHHLLLDCDLEYDHTRLDSRGREYPVMRLGDVLLHCRDTGVSDVRDIQRRWRHGVDELDWDNLLVQMTTTSRTSATMLQDLEVPWHKACMAPFESDLGCVVTLPMAGGHRNFEQMANELATMPEHCMKRIVPLLLEALHAPRGMRGEAAGVARQDLDPSAARRPGARRIAIWRYDAYGEHAHKRLERSWGDVYQVVAVFDGSRVGGRAGCGGLTVESPEHIRGQYRQGRFDAVLVEAYDASFREELARTLDKWEVPIEHVRPPRAFVQVPTARGRGGLPDVSQDGYELKCIEGAACTCAHEPQEVLFVTSGDDGIVSDNWLDGDWDWEPNLALACPRRGAPDFGSPVRVEGQCCAVARLWGGNYGHVTLQCLDQVALMEEAGYSGRYLMVRSGFSEDLMRLMGVGANRVIWLNDLDEDVCYVFDELLVLHREFANFRDYSRLSAPAVLKAVRRIESNVPNGPDPMPRRVFVKRIGTRKLLGADELLGRYGFVTVVPEEMTVEEQVRCFHEADVVVTPTGANSINSIYMRPGTSFVETFPIRGSYHWCTEVLLLKGVHHLSVTQTSEVMGDGLLPDGSYRVAESLLEMAIRNAIELSGGSL